ncbi:MAG: hypothetical protein RI601_00475 [Desulfurivibrionaceae bacterium]|nr:hypothetical protein [Desulfurivibrionaceae bacterium]
MRLVYLLVCCLLAGCTSSSRLANPLGLDLDPLLRIVDEQRPVPVVYPAGTERPSRLDLDGPAWAVLPHGSSPYQVSQ